MRHETNCIDLDECWSDIFLIFSIFFALVIFFAIAFHSINEQKKRIDDLNIQVEKQDVKLDVILKLRQDVDQRVESYHDYPN